MRRGGFDFEREFRSHGSLSHSAVSPIAPIFSARANGTHRPHRLLRTPPVPRDLRTDLGSPQINTSYVDESGLPAPRPKTFPNIEGHFLKHHISGLSPSAIPIQGTSAISTQTPETKANETRKEIIATVNTIVKQQRPDLTVGEGISVTSAVVGEFLSKRERSLPLTASDVGELSGMITTFAPPSIVSERKAANISEVFREYDVGTEAARTRIIRILARYDPQRLPFVDQMVKEAKGSQIGSADALISKLVREYGPEPSMNASEAPTIALSKPICSESGVSIYASLRSSSTAIPRWSMAAGNTTSCTPLGLDTFQQLGVARTHIVEESEGGQTLCLQLLHGAVRQQQQYTVWLSTVDHGGQTASDFVTFVA